MCKATAVNLAHPTPHNPSASCSKMVVSLRYWSRIIHSRYHECAAVTKMRASTEISEWNPVLWRKRIHKAKQISAPEWSEIYWLEDNNRWERISYSQLFQLIFIAHSACFRDCARSGKLSPLHCNHSHNLHVATHWNSSTLEIRNLGFYSQKTATILQACLCNQVPCTPARLSHLVYPFA